MANTKISALTAGAPAVGTDVIPIDRAGANFSLKVSDFGVAISSVAGVGYCFFGRDSYPCAISNAGATVSGPNVVDVHQVILKHTQKISKMSIRVSTTFGAASHIGVAIYDSTGARLASTGALDGTNVAAIQTATLGSPVTLTPGTYYIGCSSDGAATGRMYCLLPDVSNSAVMQFTNNGSNTREGTGATASAGGVPPATIGAITANQTTTPALAFVEP